MVYSLKGRKNKRVNSNNKMLNKNRLGTLYEFCSKCDSCPVAIETEVGGQSGLEIKDDFGGAVKLTDDNLKDLAAFLNKRFK